ncbi:hypothetical protein FACS1894190_10340 [Spirochaetia bacterium]|nr:hypothetical protein FACS1894190_10340 [Spirochaetia bacterium]
MRLDEIVSMIGWTLPWTLYLTIIFSMNYAWRVKSQVMVSCFFVVMLSVVFTFGVSKGFENARLMASPPLLIHEKTLGRKGMILHRADTSMVLLDSPSLETGSRVVSLPKKPLIYQNLPLAADGELIKAPPVPFMTRFDGIINDVIIDFSISAKTIRQRYDSGLIPFFTLGIALALFLTATGLISQIGQWPLANVFLGLLLFRGILAFDVFLNMKEIQEYLNDFFLGALPIEYISPLIYSCAAFLLFFYMLLFSIAQERKNNG